MTESSGLPPCGASPCGPSPHGLSRDRFRLSALRLRRGSPRRFPRRARAVAGVVLPAALLMAAAGCGIRGTSVPVDAGAAPSRVSCEVPGDPPRDGPAEARVIVYLVCSAQIMPVERTVRASEDDSPAEIRTRTADTLLSELQKRPSDPEDEGGFSTEVPHGLAVGGPRAGDPEETLRLSRIPDELPPYALAQLVCSFSGTAASPGGESVVLGGPGGGELERYTCTDELRVRPETAATSGVRLE